MPSKRKSPRKSPKKRSPTKWVTHVKKTHAQMKRSSPKATFKSALKRASRTYKK